MSADLPSDLPADLSADLTDAELATELVRRAGALALSMRQRGLVAEQKTDVSDIVTAADRAAEELVTSTLSALRPDDGVLGEEGTSREGTSGRRWVIDPVDGTWNFQAGLPYWCSAIALVDRGAERSPEGERLVLGAVHQPATDETWLGGLALETTLDGTPLPPLPDLPLAAGSLATYVHPPRIDDPAEREPILAMISGAATVRILGSGSVDLAGLVTGRVGAWAQHSCPDWDWLPGKALVEGVGGATVVVEHRGFRWHLAGPRAAVVDLERLLVTA